MQWPACLDYKNHRTDLDTKPLEDLSTRLVMTVILLQVVIYLGYWEDFDSMPVKLA